MTEGASDDLARLAAEAAAAEDARHAARQAPSGPVAKRAQPAPVPHQPTKAERRYFDQALWKACGAIAESFMPEAKGAGGLHSTDKLNAEAYAIFRMCAAGWGDPDLATTHILARINARLASQNGASGADMTSALKPLLMPTLERAKAAAYRNPRPPLQGGGTSATGANP